MSAPVSQIRPHPGQGRAPNRLRVLLIALEYPIWVTARHQSYPSFLGLEEGLRANGVDCHTVTTEWLRWIPDLFRGVQFDQVWLDLFHSPANAGEETLERLADLAPVRLGLIAESLGDDSEDYTRSPAVLHMARKRDQVARWLKYVTHVAVVDEKDVAAVCARGASSAVWWPQAVPRRFVCDNAPPPLTDRAVFCGALGYGSRANWLDYRELDEVLLHQRSPETGTAYPALFDALHATTRALIREGRPGDRGIRAVCATAFHPLRRPVVMRAAVPLYMEALRRLRLPCFAQWLRQMQVGIAVVNLPSYLRAYSGRVTEGMAAGRPMISWDVPDRPQNRSLFEDGRDLLLFSRDDPAQLAAHIRRLQKDPELAMEIASNARRQLLHSHTVERRVAQLLRWIRAGELPEYARPATQ